MESHYAPEGISINDFIDKEDFTIHYAIVDDAVAMASGYGKGCIMAKIDLNVAFCMVPIAAGEWDLLGLYWKGKYYVDTCLPFRLQSAPHIFNHAVCLCPPLDHGHQLWSSSDSLLTVEIMIPEHKIFFSTSMFSISFWKNGERYHKSDCIFMLINYYRKCEVVT